MAKETPTKVKTQKVKKHTLKEVGSELKKVSFPTLKKTVQQTGIVLGFVLVFTVVLFGIDRLLSFLYELLVNSI
ncbi:MAG: preprotein translocase subunit SecE [Clostridia bacterium]|nr:preprotein translocase subunit SecE [Clostridia bacterium]